MAMGGAFMAVEDELAAMAWNPAALHPPRCGRGVSIRIHPNILGAPAIVRETGLLTGIHTDPFADLSGLEKLSVALGGAVKAVTLRRGGLSAGVLMLEEHLDPAALAESRGLADASELLDAYYTSFAVVFRLAPTVSIGAASTVFAGWNADGERLFESGRAYGALLAPNDRVSVGLAYFDFPPELSDYRRALEGLAPRTMNAGVVYRPTEHVLLSFDLRDLAEKHEDTALAPRVGCEWNLWGRAALRAGWFSEENGGCDVITLGVGGIPMLGCPAGQEVLRSDAFVLNYAVLVSAGRSPRHLLSVNLHF